MKTRTLQAGNRGFTLLELIIVLFILGMSVAVVVFAAGRMHETAVFNDETRRVCQTMKHAREMALMERSDIIVKFDSENNRYWIDEGEEETSDFHAPQGDDKTPGTQALSGDNKAPQPPAPPRERKPPQVHTLPSGLTLSGNDIVFYAKGNSSGGTIKIKNEKGREYTIEVDPILGTPKIKRL